MSKEPGRLAFAARRQRATRVLSAALVVMAGLYVSMPLWLPTGWLARRIVRDLSADLQREVRIGAVRIGWISGITLEDLTIAERPGFPNTHLASVGRIRCPFTPLRALVTERLALVEISDAKLWISRNEEGRLNLEELPRQRRGRLPSLNYLVHRAACHIITPQAEQMIRIDRLECNLEPATGLLRVFAQAVVHHEDAGLSANGKRLQLVSPALAAHNPEPSAENSPRRFNLHARLRVPRLKRDELLQGDVRAEWEGLAITDLPLALIPRLPMEQVRGSTSGHVHLTARPDLTVDYNLSIAFNGVEVMLEGQDRPAEVPDATLRCEGHWDPNPPADVIILRDFEYETDAIRLAAAVDINVDPELPFRMECAGRIKDWIGLRREFPEIDAYLRRIQANCTGSADFTFSLTHPGAGAEVDRITLSINGTDSGVRVAGLPEDYLLAAAGVPKSLQVEMLHDRQTRRMTQPQLSIVLGDLEIDAEKGLTLPELPRGDLVEWLVTVAPTIDSQVSLRTPHVERVLALLPFLRAWHDLDTWRGPLEVSARVSRHDQQAASALHVNVAMGADTNLRVGDWFHKRPGEPLNAAVGARVPAGASGLQDLTFTLTSGPARLSLDTQRARNTWSFEFLDSPAGSHQPPEVSVDWDLPVRVERIEQLLDLSPHWRARQAELPELAGSLELSSRGSISLRAGDWLLFHELDLLADELELRWEPHLQKLAGDPLSLSTLQRWQAVGGDREHFLSASMSHPAGEAYAALGFAGAESEDPGDDFEHVTLQVDAHDVSRLMALAPALAELAASISPAGAFTIQMDSLLVDGQQTLSLTADATAAELSMPALDIAAKPAGTPAALDMKWVSQSDPAGNWQSWHLVEGMARLAGLEFSQASGSAAADWHGEASADPPTPPGGVFSRRGQEIALRSLGLAFKGQVELDEQTLALHPELTRLARELSLQGTGEWTVELQVEPDRIDLAGRLAAKDLAFTVPLGHDLLPEIRKPAELPAGLEVELSLVSAEEPGPYLVELRSLTADLAGRRIHAAGNLECTLDHKQRLKFSKLNLTARAMMDDIGFLLPLLPGNGLNELQGGVDGTVRIQLEDEELNISEGQLVLRDLVLGAGPEPIRLDGNVNFTDQQLVLEQLRWSWGKSGGVASGILDRLNGRHSGHIGLAVHRFDMDEFLWNMASLPATPGAPGEWAAADFIELLNDSSLIVDLYADTLDLLLPLDVRISVDAASARATVEDGAVNISFTSAVDGGYVTGTFITDTTEPDPVFDLEYTSERIQPGAVVDTYLALTFPGMKATGPLTLIDRTRQKLFPAPDEDNYEVGTGEFIIEGGSVAGRAAPLWLARIFPGLNFATFEFTHMHSWFDKRPDGSIHHQMIFKGNFYNIYMIGHTDAGGRIRYEVGIDFFADFDSKYWAEVGQGRVPLFIKTGVTTPDGQLLEERVTYTPPQRILETIFVKNNPVITAYHAVRKRVLKQQ